VADEWVSVSPAADAPFCIRADALYLQDVDCLAFEIVATGTT
jgi:hypothetical protein